MKQPFKEPSIRDRFKDEATVQGAFNPRSIQRRSNRSRSLQSAIDSKTEQPFKEPSIHDRFKDEATVQGAFNPRSIQRRSNRSRSLQSAIDSKTNKEPSIRDRFKVNLLNRSLQSVRGFRQAELSNQVCQRWILCHRQRMVRMPDSQPTSSSAEHECS
jgi:hypothetical protein